MRTGVGRSGRWWAAAMVMVLSLGSIAGAAGMEEGISVQGTGEAKARPTQVEIAATLSGEAELATDATVKFRDAKKRALAAVEGLKNPDLSVVSQGVSINSAMDATAQMMIQRGQPVTGAAQKVQVLESSRIVLKNADKLAPDALLDTVLKILDVAKDAGYQIGLSGAASNYEMQMQMRMGQGNSVVVFKLPDSSGLRDQAFKAAIEDAKAKAQKLAELSGVKLGRILSITQSSTSQVDSNISSIIQMMYGSAQRTVPQENGVIGSSSGDLTVRVAVAVRFDIEK